MLRRDWLLLFSAMSLMAAGAGWYWATGSRIPHPAPAEVDSTAGSVGAPEGRRAASAAYDARHGVAVIFGGRDGNHTLDDTWTFDGAQWRQQHPHSHPMTQDVGKMVYDESSQTVVFLGAADSRATEYAVDARTPPPAESHATWVWDGAEWTRILSAHQPPGTLQGLAYDRASGVVVAVTDNQTAGLSEACSYETWIWDGLDWSERSRIDAPTFNGSYPPYGSFGMATEPSSGRVVAVVDSFDGGGLRRGVVCPVGSATARPAAMWRWGNNQWKQVGPAPTLGASGWLVADSTRGEVVAYSHTTSQSGPTSYAVDELFVWSGRKWSTIEGGAPMCFTAGTGRIDASLVDDPKAGGPLLLSASTPSFANLRDVLKWNGQLWVVLPGLEACNSSAVN
jgi:hypothetical protein